MRGLPLKFPGAVLKTFPFKQGIESKMASYDFRHKPNTASFG